MSDTRPFNVRMDQALKDRIRRRVDSGEAANQSEWAREALAGVDALGGLSALARAIELVGGELGQDPHPARARQLGRAPVTRGRPAAECPHPDGQRVKTPYSERCTLCGVTLYDESKPGDPVDVVGDDVPLGQRQVGDVVPFDPAEIPTY